jgi:hypothetical protein
MEKKPPFVLMFWVCLLTNVILVACVVLMCLLMIVILVFCCPLPGPCIPLPTCTPTNTPIATSTPLPAGTPTATATSAPCGECRGGVTSLTLRYVGTTASAHIQVLQKKGEVVFDGTVQPGETFTFSGTDRYGKLGTEITIKVNGQVNTTLHTSCSKPIGPGLVSGDFEVVAGSSKDGGPLCPVPGPGGPCGECRGGVTSLTLRYNGTTADAHIQVLQKKGGGVFDGTVQPGETFTFSDTDRHGKLDKEITIKVNGQVNTTLHTSCSKPIGPGLVSGDFEVVAGNSKDGGPLCPVSEPGSLQGALPTAAPFAHVSA